MGARVLIVHRVLGEDSSQPGLGEHDDVVEAFSPDGSNDAFRVPVTTEVWTVRGLVTYYTVFVIELYSRRVHVVGPTRYPDEAFVVQAMRHLTDDIDGVLGRGCVLICDRDRKWSRAVREFLEREGVRIVQTPFRSPNCNAYAERFVRSIKEECLNHMIPLGERHLRRTIADFVAHYDGERNHQGIGNELIQPLRRATVQAPVRRYQRIGGLLNYYYRAA